MTPKSLLRHPKCVSSVEELVEGRFQEVIDDECAEVNKVKVGFFSGKLYFELLEEKEKEMLKKSL